MAKKTSSKKASAKKATPAVPAKPSVKHHRSRADHIKNRFKLS